MALLLLVGKSLRLNKSTGTLLRVQDFITPILIKEDTGSDTYHHLLQRISNSYLTKRLKQRPVIPTFYWILGTQTTRVKIRGKEVCHKLIKVERRILLKRLDQSSHKCQEMVENMVIKNLSALQRILFLKHLRVIEHKLGHQLVTYVTSFSTILMQLQEVKEVKITPTTLLL